MRVYAKQVPPEYQESPLFMEDWPEDVYVFGNRSYNQHAERLEEIRAALQDLADEWENLNDGGRGYYGSWIEALNDILPPDYERGEYTRAERLELAKLAAQFEWCGSDAENDILCDVLEIITGRQWENNTSRGCCQGDWQEIIYPAEYGRAWLEEFETEYFNTGEEWRINEGDPDSGDNYYFYSHGWNDALIRQEIAEAAGVDPGDVVLFKFTGWSRSASYEEVTA